MFMIFGKYNGQTEEVDQFDTKEEALKMLNEYRLAYGSAWTLWVKAL